jgi:Xaa-Pro aminopeptidase
VKTLRPGATGDSVFAAWQAELVRQGARVTTELGRHAVAKWAAGKKGVPFWELHTTGLVVALPAKGLREGMTVDLEPIADVDGQAFYLEDMFLVTRDGAELLTPGLPTSADEIEAAMAGR